MTDEVNKQIEMATAVCDLCDEECGSELACLLDNLATLGLKLAPLTEEDFSEGVSVVSRAYFATLGV